MSVVPAAAAASSNYDICIFYNLFQPPPPAEGSNKITCCTENRFVWYKGNKLTGKLLFGERYLLLNCSKMIFVWFAETLYETKVFLASGSYNKKHGFSRIQIWISNYALQTPLITKCFPLMKLRLMRLICFQFLSFFFCRWASPHRCFAPISTCCWRTSVA